ncbi:MAG: hypothetical protein ACK56F_09140 [bacterium]
MNKNVGAFGHPRLLSSHVAEKGVEICKEVILRRARALPLFEEVPETAKRVKPSLSLLC